MPRAKIYQLKVTLKGTKPPIWRRFQIEETNTLGDLHTILQIVMGWTDCHLHAFDSASGRYGTPMPDSFDFIEAKDEEAFRVSDVLRAPKARIRYEYDFGDGWEHDVVVEKSLDPKPGTVYPLCITGRRNCPPEDCGGVWGFYNMLEAVRDPKHPEHEDYREWLGYDYDEEALDLEDTNAALKDIIKLGRQWRKEMRNAMSSM